MDSVLGQPRSLSPCLTFGYAVHKSVNIEFGGRATLEAAHTHSPFHNPFYSTWVLLREEKVGWISDLGCRMERPGCLYGIELPEDMGINDRC